MVDEVFQCFLGLEAVVAIFQVDVFGFEFVPVADAGPKVFVFGHFIRRQVADTGEGFSHRFEGLQIGGADAEEGERFEEGALVHGIEYRSNLESFRVKAKESV